MALTLYGSVKAEPLTPEWWIERLWARLVARDEEIELFSNYYSGNHPLPWLSPQAAEEFRQILCMCRANYMGLVVDAQTERMFVNGFRVGATPTEMKADEDTWAIWQFNDLDGFYPQGLLEAGIAGHMYLHVAPNPKRRERPYIWVEHPSQVVVEHRPGTNRTETVAALKVWEDEWTGHVHAILQYQEWIWKFQASYPSLAQGQATTPGRRRLITPLWEPRYTPGEDWPARNPIGEVSFFESPNNPRLLTGGRSELEDLWPIQDRVNKTIADRIITQDYGAFPQKWASAWPEVTESGEPNPIIESGRNRIVTTDVAETRFGQWAAADMDPYSLAKREDVKDIASRSRTPAQYLLGEMSNVNGDTLKASESGLVAKVRQRCAGHTDPLERAMRMARKLAGLTSNNEENLETIWRNPEFRTEGELVDALSKMKATLNVPEEVCWEIYGATPQEIARWTAINDEKLRKDPTALFADRFRAPAIEADASIRAKYAPKPTTGGGRSTGARSGGKASDGGRGGEGQRSTSSETAATRRESGT